jgi:hypothetical protein
MSVEERLQKLEDLVEDLIIEKEELTNRMDELEDDHITQLLRACLCNNDGGDNTSCESTIHYCMCKKLKERTYDCRSKSFGGLAHNCICPYEVKDGQEVSTRVKWCRGHNDNFHMEDKVDEHSNKKVSKLIKKYNPRTFMRQFLARLKK